MKHLYLYFGFASISAGLVGIFLPVMPTTPFILLSIWFFHKTDSEFEQVILKNRWIGSHIRYYMQDRSMKRSFKWKTIVFVWLGLGISIYLQSNLYIRALLAVIGLAVTIHIALLNKRQCQDASESFLEENSM
jgi:uncharacterized membrane protein YbaN (DUF454 family)